MWDSIAVALHGRVPGQMFTGPGNPLDGALQVLTMVWIAFRERTERFDFGNNGLNRGGY
jgi:hypothetical protein